MKPFERGHLKSKLQLFTHSSRSSGKEEKEGIKDKLVQKLRYRKDTWEGNENRLLESLREQAKVKNWAKTEKSLQADLWKKKQGRQSLKKKKYWEKYGKPGKR